MSKTPHVPEEQISPGGGSDSNPEAKGDARDRVTELQSGQPGDAGNNLSEQGRYGNVKQNTTHQGYQQDR
jgi:hypothetical protein